MLGKLLTLVISSLITFLIAEVAVRVLYPEWAPGTPNLANFWRYDKDLGWAHEPGVDGIFASYGFEIDVTINSSGFRGPEFPDQNDDRPRILVMGDSFVWGFGVEQDEIFTSRLAASCDADVINLGVSGYSTDQELLLLRSTGLPLDPDVVVLVVADNDFSTNLKATEYVYYHKPVFTIDGDELTLTNHPVPQASIFIRGAATIARQSYILTQLGRMVQVTMNARATEDAFSATAEPVVEAEPVPAATPSFPVGQADVITSRLIQQFHDDATAAGVEVVLAFQTPRGALVANHLALPAPVVLLDDLTGGDNHDRYHIPHDIHWNVDGHELVAQALHETLADPAKMKRSVCAPVPD